MIAIIYSQWALSLYTFACSSIVYYDLSITLHTVLCMQIIMIPLPNFCMVSQQWQSQHTLITFVSSVAPEATHVARCQCKSEKHSLQNHQGRKNSDNSCGLTGLLVACFHIVGLWIVAGASTRSSDHGVLNSADIVIIHAGFKFLVAVWRYWACEQN